MWAYHKHNSYLYQTINKAVCVQEPSRLCVWGPACTPSNPYILRLSVRSSLSRSRDRCYCAQLHPMHELTIAMQVPLS
uniref:Uncharacterized protein n=1 Tax=Anguilla anguilla TaxID=7936 RepID=A0A0E9WAL9_ANGAN